VTPGNTEMKTLDERLEQLRAELRTLYSTAVDGQRQRLALIQSERGMLTEQLDGSLAAQTRAVEGQQPPGDPA
jgi:septal ring factor EnvC (AmiA/AmiB activator)